jgi:hypothetical protein
VRRTTEAFNDKLTLVGVEYQSVVLENQGHALMLVLTRKDLVLKPEKR